MLARLGNKYSAAPVLFGLLLMASPGVAAPQVAAPPVAAPNRAPKRARLIKSLMLSVALYAALPVHPGVAATPAGTSCNFPETVATVLAQTVDSKHFTKEVPFGYRVAAVGLKLIKPTFAEFLGPQVSLETGGAAAALKIAFSPHVLAPDRVPAQWRVPLLVSANKAAPLVERFASELARGEQADWSVVKEQARQLTPMLDYRSLPKDAATADLMWLLENFAAVPAQKELARCVGVQPTAP